MPTDPQSGTAATVPGRPGPRPVHPPLRTLREVATRLALPADSPAWAALAVTGVSLASSRIRPGDLFVALPGGHGHGAGHARAALDQGALAILTDPAGAALLAGTVGADVPVLVVDDPRARLGALASWLYGDPSQRVDVLAVTGTSGKTSVTYLLEAGLAGADRAAGVIGTTGTRIAGVPVATALTTPEAPDLHALLAVMAEQGVLDAAVEVSSHALVLGRADGLRARVALFTNLGRDHLDFHADMAEYLDAKARLFTPEHTRSAVVCVDGGLGEDTFVGVEVAHRARAAGVEVQTLSVLTESVSGSGSVSGREGAGWQVSATRAAPDGRGSTFTLCDPEGRSHEVVLALPGAFQVANAALAIAGLVVAGVGIDDAIAGVGRCTGVPGRLERVEAGQRFLALVDYAHKPPALETVLGALRPGPGGRLIVVLGAGGDRDRGKRPIMGAVAARLADLVVVTDDNPRSEDPAAIRAAVLAGARATPDTPATPATPATPDNPDTPDAARAADLVEEGDRRAAIRLAVRAARDADIVVVAGKGHESGQERHGMLEPFDDRVVLAEELAALLSGAGR